LKTINEVLIHLNFVALLKGWLQQHIWVFFCRNTFRILSFLFVARIRNWPPNFWHISFLWCTILLVLWIHFFNKFSYLIIIIWIFNNCNNSCYSPLLILISILMLMRGGFLHFIFLLLKHLHFFFFLCISSCWWSSLKLISFCDHTPIYNQEDSSLMTYACINIGDCSNKNS